MPLKKGKKNIRKNVLELKADNLKKGKAKGANGKSRSKAQILAIASSLSGEKNNSKMHEGEESKSFKKKEAKMYKKS